MGAGKLRVLITGGAGYIGSHVIKEVHREFGDSAEILTVDNLSTGHREAVLYGKLVVGDIRDRKLMDSLMEDFRPDVIMHFSALIVAPESVEKPVEYWDNNVGGMISLLLSVKNFLSAGLNSRQICFIFSSTAAVYGTPEKNPISEDAPLHPENPYGETKLACERMLKNFSDAEKNFSFVSLRYFNAAGADPEGELGQSSPNPTHLILRAVKVAKGELPLLEIYGVDYPTPDGTCIRDYIHVSDLAYSHILAMKYLLDGGKSDIFNVGYGEGHSVLEVVSAVERVTGKKLKKRVAGRRPGDPVSLIANPEKIEKTLGFSPRYNDLDFIVKTAWQWELNRRY